MFTPGTIYYVLNKDVFQVQYCYVPNRNIKIENTMSSKYKVRTKMYIGLFKGKMYNFTIGMTVMSNRGYKIYTYLPFILGKCKVISQGLT